MSWSASAHQCEALITEYLPPRARDDSGRSYRLRPCRRYVGPSGKIGDVALCSKHWAAAKARLPLGWDSDPYGRAWLDRAMAALRRRALEEGELEQLSAGR